MLYHIFFIVVFIAVLGARRVHKRIMGSNAPTAVISDAPSPKTAYACKVFSYEKIEARAVQPLARSGHRIVADSKFLYSFGGYNPQIPVEHQRRADDDDFPLFQELWKFNFATKEWTLFSICGALPLELASNAVVRLGNALMVYGGTGAPFGQSCSNSLYVCTLTDALCKVAEMETTGHAPTPQYGQALVYNNEFLYTIGGTTGYTYTCDIHRLNLSTKIWEQVYVCHGHEQNEPKGRYRHEVAFFDSKIFILGGGTSEVVYDFKDLPAFDIVTLEWCAIKTYPDPLEPLKGLPKGRRCHGAVQIDDVVFICGGYDGDEVFSDMWRLDLQTFTWTLIESCTLSHPTYFHSTAVTPEGKLYVFGGIIKQRNETVRNNWIFSTWLKIPKLSELCWEALLHYRPELTVSQEEQLVGIGLPRHFIHRTRK